MDEVAAEWQSLTIWFWVSTFSLLICGRVVVEPGICLCKLNFVYPLSIHGCHVGHLEGIRRGGWMEMSFCPLSVGHIGHTL
jgi:hypothetical protein